MDDKKRKVNLNTERLKDIENLTTGRIYGMDQKIIDQIEEEREKIKDSISSVNKRQNHIIGDGMIEFFASMVYEDTKPTGKKKKPTENVNAQERFKEILDVTNSTHLSNMFYLEKDRILLYDEYEQVINYITQVYQALDAMADAIISPDDFSKKILNYTYDGIESPSLREHEEIIRNVEKIEKNYKIEEKLKKIIFDSLFLGDTFVSVSSLKKEFDKILTEAEYIENLDSGIINESSLLMEDNFILSESEKEVLKDMVELSTKNEKSKDEKDTKNETSDMPKDEEIKRTLMKLLNDNIEYSTNSKSIIEKDLKIMKELMNDSNKFTNSNFETVRNSYEKEVKNSDKSSSMLFSNVDEAEKNRYKTVNPSNIKSGSTTNKHQTDVRGSYVKILDPRRTVKLTLGETCFGYFYIETELPQNQNVNAFSSNTKMFDFNLRNAVDITASGGSFEEEINNPKVKIISDIFGRALATKVNKKFVEDNREFKSIIYELLKHDYILKKRVRIVYLSPEDVFHFTSELGPDGYGVSKLKKVLFSCKIYLATLVTNLMMKLSRSADHRAFYVETGLSRDVENTIQSFIRDVKSKEVRLNDMKTIDTIFRSIGQLIKVDIKVY